MYRYNHICHFMAPLDFFVMVCGSSRAGTVLGGLFFSLFYTHTFIFLQGTLKIIHTHPTHMLTFDLQPWISLLSLSFRVMAYLAIVQMYCSSFPVLWSM